jgi:hypothetical protein
LAQPFKGNGVSNWAKNGSTRSTGVARLGACIPAATGAGGVLDEGVLELLAVVDGDGSFKPAIAPGAGACEGKACLPAFTI